MLNHCFQALIQPAIFEAVIYLFFGWITLDCKGQLRCFRFNNLAEANRR